MTLRLHNATPISWVVSAGDIETLIKGADRLFRLKVERYGQLKAHALVREAVVASFAVGDAASLQGCLHAAFWLALNHPIYATDFRRGLSQTLRQHGRAHITVVVDKADRWAFAVAEQATELRSVISQFPDSDEPMAACISTEGPEQALH